MRLPPLVFPGIIHNRDFLFILAGILLRMELATTWESPGAKSMTPNFFIHDAPA